jgi:predicted nuclease of predicted toxin-antitoxin system
VRLLLDQNLSYKLVSRWQDLFPGSAHLREFGLTQADDAEVWAFAAAGSYVVTTKDRDFEDEALFPGPPPKCIRLAVGNTSTNEIDEFVRDRVSEVLAFEQDEQRQLVLS